MMAQTRIPFVVAAASVALAAFAAPAHARQECAVGDKPINLDNGASTEKLTGRVVCKDRDSGKVEREIPYVAGKEEGVGVMRMYDGKRRETTYRAGKKNGLEREYDPAGKLLAETHYTDDHELGEGRVFFPDGKVKKRILRRDPEIETLRFEYDEAGHLLDLRCGSQVEMPIGRHPCHYERRTEVVRLLHPNGKPKEIIPLSGGWRDGKSERFSPDGTPAGFMTFKAGKQSGVTEERSENGQLARRTSYVDGEHDGPDETFFPDGTLSKRTVFARNRTQSVLQMWQNGKQRSLLTIEDGGKSELLEEFFDNGKPESVALSARALSRWGSEALLQQGLVKRWYETGKVASEETYDKGELDGPSQHHFEDGTLQLDEVWKAGKIAARKEYDEHGKLVKDEHYNEDGSRK